MEVIICHIYADLDALSSMVMARKLYPNAKLCFPGNVGKSVKAFVNLYQDYLNVEKAKDIDYKKVKKLIIVDTAKKDRIGHFENYLDKIEEIVIFDHHKPSDKDIPNSKLIRSKCGSNTTNVLKEIFRKNENAKFERYEATLALLGIYEDTGSFTFEETTVDDFEMAKRMLEFDGQIKLVSEYVTKDIGEEQLETFINLIKKGEVLEFSLERCFITLYETKEFVSGVDEIINKIKDIESCNSCFIVIGNHNKFNIIARTSSKNINLIEILEEYNWQGHENVASVVIKNQNMRAVYNRLKERIIKEIQVGKLAKDIMSSPVKVVTELSSIKNAYKLMNRWGYTGLPIVNGENEIIGLISRRDVDKAMGHGFSNAPLKSYMNKNLILVKPESSLDEVKKIIVENGLGIVPVVEERKILGIITREDMLRYLYVRTVMADEEFQEKQKAFKLNLLNKIPHNLEKLLHRIEKVSKKRQEKAYLVGGIVRDLILGIENKDIDIVVEGDGISFARDLNEELNGIKVSAHEEFKTAVVTVDKDLKIDVASARIEYYEFPTSLPSVESGNVKEDMYRRDFTINSLALEIDYENFGKLIDYYNGYSDIKNKKIRILHNLSFIEDPTRIIRAFRFASRYNFELEEDTEKFLIASIEEGFLNKISWPRVKAELKILLKDKNTKKALEFLVKYGVLEKIHPKAVFNEEIEENLKRIEKYSELIKEHEIENWLMNFLILLENLEIKELDLVFNKFSFSREFISNYHYGIKKREEIVKELDSEVKNSSIYKTLGELKVEILILILIQHPELEDKVLKYLELKDEKPKVMGRDLIKLGLNPSPKFKNMLKNLYYLQLDNSSLTKEELLDLAKEWGEK